MSNMSQYHYRIDPIFKLRTPLLFAHRGGALEVPESTILGFRHAIEIARTDVLELDVQLTNDGKFVVWHGPELNNVRIEGEPDIPSDRKRTKIYHFDWDELDGKAWVADPDIKKISDEKKDLSIVPKDQDRCLLLLTEFLTKFPDIPLNIEMKKSFKRKINETDRKGLKDNITVFSKILNKNAGARTIVVVSAIDDYIDEFRAINGETYPTGLSPFEQLRLNLLDMETYNRALETSYSKYLSSKKVVKKVSESGGSTFVFLTGFGPFLPAIDKKVPSDKTILEILERGVDGIMTDRPKSVREIFDRWKI